MLKKLSILMALVAVCVLCEAQGSGWRDTNHTYTMKATYYADKFVGRKTSSGEVFSQELYTAAHHSMPFHTLVLVTNMKTGNQVVVKINDRCPKHGVIDLSKRAAESIDITHRNGVAPVTVRVLGEEYFDFWSRQGEMREVMQAGEVFESDEPLPLPEHTEKQSNNTQGTNGAPNNAQQADTKKPTTANDGCYNLKLCSITLRQEASATIAKLPIYYQESAAVVTNGSNGLAVILDLRQSRQKVEEVRRELLRMFPGSTVMQCDRW